MRLIVNADDFGFSPGKNYGIIDAYQNGIVRSATLMVNAAAADQAISLAKEHPGLGVGAHLVIDLNAPLSPPERIPSLVTADGSFRKPPFASRLAVDLAEVELEWRAQIEFLISQGIQPSHLDSHHHFHLHPQLVPVTCKLAGDFHLPLRMPSPGFAPEKSDSVYEKLEELPHPDCCLTDFYAATVGEEYFLTFFAAHPQLREKSVELMCHPAYMDDVIASRSSYNVQRVRELQVLKSAAVRRWVRENEIELINFHAL